ncbi:unnamed protein product [Dovyalis caffra]|uniref:Uncharacterized protein n=1 Tax=Dovyalis caffra TaxID=77055 RepID=A0AAV1RWF4_9ROSI|nr:unnamed protein product [Dovyalis caffra]
MSARLLSGPIPEGSSSTSSPLWRTIWRNVSMDDLCPKCPVSPKNTAHVLISWAALVQLWGKAGVENWLLEEGMDLVDRAMELASLPARAGELCSEFLSVQKTSKPPLVTKSSDGGLSPIKRALDNKGETLGLESKDTVYN